MFSDQHGRQLTYLRLAVTDRCNLRCTYCMPERGMKFYPRDEILSYEEMLRLANIMARNGVDKVRITGGEPFVRKNLIHFLKELSGIDGIRKIGITTNGVLTQQYLPELIQLGIKDINLSIDSINPVTFKEITRKDVFESVEQSMNQMLREGFNLKLNAVVLSGKNTHELHELAGLAQEQRLEVRFIEEMPFNGSNKADVSAIHWNAERIAKHLREFYPELTRQPGVPQDTAIIYEAPSFKGRVGIIPAFTRTICGGCNRIRVTADGTLKTCLYDQGKNNLKALLRNGYSDTEIEAHLKTAVLGKAKDGFEAQSRLRNGTQARESMSLIGG